MPSAATLRPLGIAAFACLVGGGCAPQAVTEQGRRINGLYDIFSVTAAVIFVIVVGLITWSLLRYRSKSEEEIPAQTRDNVPLELLWFAIPQIIVVALFAITVSAQEDVGAQSSAPNVEVRVEGFQWGWRFTLESESVTVSGTSDAPPKLVLPVGRTIAFSMTSNDVNHSFYVPKFLMKRDAIPGEPNRFDVTIEEPGTYPGVCAEFCGLLHETMNFNIQAVQPAAYEAWLNEQRAGNGNG